MCHVRSVCLITALAFVLRLTAGAQYAPAGQPLVGNGTAPQTSTQYQDAHINDAGNDMSQAISATWMNCVHSTGPAGQVGCAIKAGYTGYQDGSVNFFAGDNGSGGDVDLCSAGVTDLRMQTTIVLPNGAHLHGCAESGTDQTNQTYYNTIIRACNKAFLSGGWPTFAVLAKVGTPAAYVRIFHQ
jgi:hypothetical protein